MLKIGLRYTENREQFINTKNLLKGLSVSRDATFFYLIIIKKKIAVKKIMVVFRGHLFGKDKIFALFPMLVAGNIVNFMVAKISHQECENKAW